MKNTQTKKSMPHLTNIFLIILVVSAVIVVSKGWAKETSFAEYEMQRIETELNSLSGSYARVSETYHLVHLPELKRAEVRFAAAKEALGSAQFVANDDLVQLDSMHSRAVRLRKRRQAMKEGRFNFEPSPEDFAVVDALAGTPDTPPESFSFGELPAADITPPPGAAPVVVWAWKDAPAYKNEILARYQKLLQDRGVTDSEALRLFTAQLVQENGALSPDVIGDHGCSIGIPQYNACAKHRTNAKRWIELHPEWATLDHQLAWMADTTAGTLERFKGDVRLTIIAHNCPACARGGKDTKARYYGTIAARAESLITL